MNMFRVGGTVKLNAGFESFPNANENSLVFLNTTAEFNFTLIDNKAEYVVLSAAFAAITTILF
jgi:hypothetical protein